MIVRRAEAEDVPWLLAELREFAACHPIALFGPSDYAEALLGTLIREQYVAIAVNAQGDRVGLIAGVYGPHPFNPDLKVASELWWWVSGPHRGTSAGARLLAGFEGWANERGADAIAMTLEAVSPDLDASLLRRGYVPAERHFMKALTS